MEILPEPWLRGPIPGVHALIAPVLYSFQQAREDIAKHTEGRTTKQIWATPHGFGSVGFHIRHIAGSVDRLITHLEGQQLSEAQMAALLAEKEPGATREELLAGMDAAFHQAESVVHAIDLARLTERPRIAHTSAAWIGPRVYRPCVLCHGLKLRQEISPDAVLGGYHASAKIDFKTFGRPQRWSGKGCKARERSQIAARAGREIRSLIGDHTVS